MKYFLTGATGFIGSAIGANLIKSGHEVIGLARSEASAKKLKELGFQVHQGELEDLKSLKIGAMKSDGVVHTAFNHDFLNFKQNCENDRKAIEALGSGLIETKKKLIVASGISAFFPDRLTTENDKSVPSSEFPRAATEEALMSVANLGVDASLIRIPPLVHDLDKQGIASYLIDIAKKSGVSAYVDNGANSWPAVHRIDVAKAFALALEVGISKQRYHAVAEESVSLKDIATSIGKLLNIPLESKTSKEDIETHFGWLSNMLRLDLSASSEITKSLLKWKPNQVGLLSDIENANL